MSGVKCHSVGERYDRVAVSAIRERLCEDPSVIQLRVQSASMQPVIRPHELISVEGSAFERISAGDIIVYERSGMFVVHRVLLKRSAMLITKGDNARAADAAVGTQSLLGRVVSVQRGERRISFDTFFWRLIGRLIGLVSYLESAVYARYRGKRTALSDLSA